MTFILLRLAPLTAGGDLERLARWPHWWNLWCYHHLRVQEQREAAVRAVEREELVYGLSHAHHDPKGLTEWRQQLRQSAGLLAAPKTAKERALEMAFRLRDATWNQVHP